MNFFLDRTFLARPLRPSLGIIRDKANPPIKVTFSLAANERPSPLVSFRTQIGDAVKMTVLIAIPVTSLAFWAIDKWFNQGEFVTLLYEELSRRPGKRSKMPRSRLVRQR
jgi:hypothetical protein